MDIKISFKSFPKVICTGQVIGGTLIQMDWIKEHSEGVIALSGGRLGEIGQAILSGRLDLAAEKLQQLHRIFPNRFYIEVTRTQRPGEETYLHQVVSLADQFEVPLVATNDVRFISQSQFEIHEARVCITEGRTLTDPRRGANIHRRPVFKITCRNGGVV